MLYKELLQLWIEEKRKEVRTSTCDNYLYTINNRVVPVLGDMEISLITKRILQDFVFKLFCTEGLKHETVVNIAKVLSQSFKFALEYDLIKESPFRNIIIPKDKEHKEINPFTLEEIKRLLELKNYSIQKKNIINIAFRTGLRIGEILTLKWDDINFEHKFLMVRRTMSSYQNGTVEICEPKTKSSKRRVDLDKNIIKILSEIEHNGEYVFCKEDGTIFSRQSITSSFKRMCNAAQVPYRNFHTLRHTHASILLVQGVYPAIVQERLGHCDISTTVNIYGHFTLGMQKEAVNIFDTIDMV